MASGGWAGSTRSQRYPADWHRRRQRVLRRDGHQCQWGSLPSDRAPYGLCLTRATDVDHTGDSEDHREEALRSLCRAHHRLRSGRQGGQASALAHQRRVASRRLPEEPHPGGW